MGADNQGHGNLAADLDIGVVASLILGKSALVTEMLPFINRFPDKPLMWNVAWKTLMYAIAALIIHYLERLYENWKEAPNLVAANQQIWADMTFRLLSRWEKR